MFNFYLSKIKRVQREGRRCVASKKDVSPAKKTKKTKKTHNVYETNLFYP